MSIVFPVNIKLNILNQMIILIYISLGLINVICIYVCIVMCVYIFDKSNNLKGKFFLKMCSFFS